MGEATPPNSTNPEDLVNSTPYNKGTASVAEVNNDLRAKATHNITNLLVDLKKRMTTPIIPLLRSLICRILLERKREGTNGIVTLEHHREISKVAEGLFREILGAALKFCGDGNLIYELNRYSDMSLEIERYVPLSNALNGILTHFRVKTFGDIPAPNSRANKEEIIFTPNEPQTLVSEYLQDKTYSKPDICAVFLSRLCQTDDTRQDFNFDDMVNEIATHGRKSEWQEEEKIQWIDAHQPWELKRSDKNLGFIAQDWESMTVDMVIQENERPLPNPTSGPPTQSTSSSPPQPPQPAHPPSGQQHKKQSSKKRTFEGKDEGSAKRSRTSEGPRQSMTGPLPKDDKKETGEKKGANQYARYALERLSAEWYVTCSSVVLLNDTTLTLHWFDAQGCLESEPIDIFKQLPLFITMVAILQRFTPHNWGLSQRDKSRVTVEGREFLLEENNQKLYQLHGRRTHVAFATDPPVTPATGDARPPPQGNPTSRIPGHRYSTRRKATAVASEREADGTVPAQNTESQGDPLVAKPAVMNATGEGAAADEGSQSTSSKRTTGYCFKKYDKEAKRAPEFATVKLIYARAQQHLPARYLEMVTNHLPDIVVGEECHGVTTADIRLHAKLAGGLPDISEEEIMERARVRILMLSRTLKDVMELGPSEFWKVFWDIMRCLYLLWKLGIAHGDVSLANMMCETVEEELRGILNDFDLAAVMTDECRSPEKKGWERTGTLPFMALDLLNFCNGEIKRWFRHDLESGTWCLAYQMLSKEFARRDWFAGTFEDVFRFKLSVIQGFRMGMVKENWRPYYHFMKKWLAYWSDFNKELNNQTADLIPEPGTKEFEIREEFNKKKLDEEFIRFAVDAAKDCGLDISNVPALKDTSWIDVQLQNLPLVELTTIPV